jgi:hypothetical protein
MRNKTAKKEKRYEDDSLFHKLSPVEFLTATVLLSDVLIETFCHVQPLA